MERNAHKDLAMKPFGRLSRKFEDNIKIGLKEIKRKGLDWIHLAEKTSGGLLKAR
jgi:hypothetical protein